jgi:outer membrane protein, heavy metal efflux system
MVRFLVCSALVVTLPSLAYGQSFVIPDRLTLEDALRLAAERNPTIDAGRSGVAVREAERIGARLRPNPAVTFDSENYPMFDPRRPDFLNNQQLTIRVDQELELAGRRRLRVQSADADVAVAQSLLADQRRRLELEVRRAYFSVVLAKADVEVAETSLGEINRVIGLNRARYEQGEISGGEVRRVQVERLRFVDDLFAAQLALRNARSALLALLNAPDLSLDFDVTETLSDGASTFPGVVPLAASAGGIDALQSLALAQRPDLRAALGEVQRADTETRLQRALRTPNVTLGGGYQRNFGADAVVFTVTVPLPLNNRNQGGVARAAAERRRADALAAATTTAVRLDLQQALNAVDVAAARVSYIEGEYLAPARESRDIVRAAYELGTADLIDYLDAQRAFRDTLRTYNRALFDRRISLFNLASATGAGSTSGVKP